MATIKNYTELECWKASKLLFIEVDQLIKENESVKDNFVLRDQLFRATLSISNNIAEGFGRFSNRGFLRFLNIARGSCFEVENMLLMMQATQAISNSNAEKLFKLIHKVRITSGGLVKYLSKLP